MDRELTAWMWSEACDVLARAERLHRRLFDPVLDTDEGPSWEPPVDVLETPDAVVVLVALPGVGPDRVTAAIEDGMLMIAGSRMLPPAWRAAVFHRLELPQGRFERRVRIPAGRYGGVSCTAAEGCLLITLEKVEASHG